MDMLPVILFLLGLVLIILGSNWFIDSTIWIASALRVPQLIIGATLVSLCTTLPEAMVSVSSSLMGNSSIAFGNAMGSIAANTGFILGLSIFLTKPPIRDKRDFLKKASFLLLLLMAVMTVGLLSGVLTHYMGLGLIFLLILYLVMNTKQALTSKSTSNEKYVKPEPKEWVKPLILFAIGLFLTINGANLLVENGEKIAVMLGVPDIIIGLTLTAIGTSLPELVTALTAAYKKATDLSLGNLIGANLMNILMVIGLSSSILPINISRDFLSFHLPFIIIIVLIPFFASMGKKEHFNRLTGLGMMMLYILYLGINMLGISI